jgi:hypothetical protein
MSKNMDRIDDVQQALIRAGKTLTFTLGVIKAIEIVSGKKLL